LGFEKIGRSCAKNETYARETSDQWSPAGIALSPGCNRWSPAGRANKLRHSLLPPLAFFDFLEANFCTKYQIESPST
jgi:hypothetical protein